MCRTVKKGDRWFNPGSNKDRKESLHFYKYFLFLDSTGRMSKQGLGMSPDPTLPMPLMSVFQVSTNLRDRSACVHVFPSVIVSVKGRHRYSRLMSSGREPRAERGKGYTCARVKYIKEAYCLRLSAAFVEGFTCLSPGCVLTFRQFVLHAWSWPDDERQQLNPPIVHHYMQANWMQTCPCTICSIFMDMLMWLSTERTIEL